MAVEKLIKTENAYSKVLATFILKFRSWSKVSFSSRSFAEIAEISWPD